MAALKELLPPVKSTIKSQYDHSNDPWFKQRFSTSSESDRDPFAVTVSKSVPPYENRKGFRPRKPEDFGDGGAFPEVHMPQYPLGMGRRDGQQKSGSTTLALTVDSHGDVAYDAIVKQNENARKIVYSQHKDLPGSNVRVDLSPSEILKLADVILAEIELIV